MKQVLQSLRNAESLVAEVPCPAAAAGSLLIASTVSLISSGTERMLVDFGRGSLLDKVRQQPDKVRQVMEKMRTDGVAATLEAVQSKLDQPLAMGYCNVGEVVAIRTGRQDFSGR